MAEDTKKLGKGGAVIPKKPGRKLRYGCMIGICLALLPVAINLMVSFLAREEFRRELELARKNGMPRTAGELAPPRIPDEENAAILYGQAALKLVQPTTPEETAFEVYLTWKVDPEKERTQLGMLSAYIEKNRAALDLLHEGARRPGCRYDLRYGDGFSMALPHLSQLRQSSKLMRLEAKKLLAEGKEREALRAIEDLYALGDASRDEPLVISMLVRCAMSAVASDPLRRALQEPLTDVEALASLAAALEKKCGDDHFRRAMRAERFYGIDTMERVRRDGWQSVQGALGGPSGVDWGYRFFGWALYKDASFYLKSMSTWTELGDQPYWQTRAAETKLVQDSQRLPPWYLLSRLLLPAFDASRRSWTANLARRDGARLAVALQRYRLAHGAWPDKLDKLAPEFLPEVPLDPFTGSPFRYKADGPSARVYSLGPLGFDNGGGSTGQNDDGAILFPLGDQAPFQGK